ncbi:MAG: nuclease, partial [Cyanobacteria bacterium P01_H01_bin.130]
MLDFITLAKQMQGIGDHLTQEAIAAQSRVIKARSLLASAQKHQQELIQTQHQWRDRLSFTAAEPVEPLD